MASLRQMTQEKATKAMRQGILERTNSGEKIPKQNTAVISPVDAQSFIFTNKVKVMIIHK